MKYFRQLIVVILLALLVSACGKQKGLEIYVTTDLHGMLLPFDNTEGTPTDRSLANLASLVSSQGIGGFTPDIWIKEELLRMESEMMNLPGFPGGDSQLPGLQ